jgi:hypothetical protein
MSTIELRNLVERAGGTFRFFLFDDGYTLSANLGGRSYRETERWGDRSLATDRMYTAMVTDGVLTDDDGSTVNHFEGE